MRDIGRNLNRYDETATAVIPVNSTVAVVLAEADERRIHFSVTLAPGTQSADICIRYYPAAQDNNKEAEDILVRRVSGNDTLFSHHHTMATDNIYTGEISAISFSGTINVLVSEG